MQEILWKIGDGANYSLLLPDAIKNEGANYSLVLRDPIAERLWQLLLGLQSAAHNDHDNYSLVATRPYHRTTMTTTPRYNFVAPGLDTVPGLAKKKLEKNKYIF